MFNVSDIHSLTDFQRNARNHLQRLKDTQRPEVLTVNGKPEIVVQDAQSYQALIDELERLQALAGIKQGLNGMRAGEGKDAHEFLEQLRRQLNVDPAP